MRGVPCICNQRHPKTVRPHAVLPGLCTFAAGRMSTEQTYSALNGNPVSVKRKCTRPLSGPSSPS